MKKCCLSLASALFVFALSAQDPVVKPVHAIPAETLKAPASDVKRLPLEKNQSILSCETSKDKKQVTITPMPVDAASSKETKTEKK
jgi:hypothetical protein